MNRAIKTAENSWFHLGWSGEYLKYGKNLAAPRGDFNLFSTTRILVRQIPSKPPYCINACLVDEVVLNDLNSMNIINIQIPPEHLLGILNSKLISFWFIHKFGKMQRGIFPQFKINELAVFPIPKTTGILAQTLTMNVREILQTKRSHPETSTLDLDKAIDLVVYQLFSLTSEEIAIVEGSR